ncbi:hypothetical protein AB9E30_39420, partial [Rhizobium leguminosarum]
MLVFKLLERSFFRKQSQMKVSDLLKVVLILTQFVITNVSQVYIIISSKWLLPTEFRTEPPGVPFLNSES